MEITNINSKYNYIQANQSSLKAELSYLEKNFKLLMGEYHQDPSKENLTRLTAFMYQMRTFLEDHKKEIFAEAKQNGWPKEFPHKEASYEYTYETLMININAFLNPSDGHSEGGLDFINEQLTQLSWFLSNGELQ